MSIASMMSGMASGKMPQGHEGREPMDGIPEHLKEMQEKHGGSHMHIHSDGMSHTTHHIHEGGEVQGPHEHPDEEALKEHVGKFAAGEDGGDKEDGDSIFS